MNASYKLIPLTISHRFFGSFKEVTVSNFFLVKLTQNPPYSTMKKKKKPKGKGSLQVAIVTTRGSRLVSQTKIVYDDFQDT